MLGNIAFGNLFEALELVAISSFLWPRSGFGCIHLRGDQLSLGLELEGPVRQQSAQTIPDEALLSCRYERLSRHTWRDHTLF